MKVVAVVALLGVAVFAANLPFTSKVARGSTVLEPPKMPCAFSIDVSSRVEYWNHSDLLGVFEDTSIAYFDGTLVSKYSFSFGKLEYDIVIYRTDQSYKDEKTGETYYTKYSAMVDLKQGVNESCEAVGISRGDMQAELESDFSGFLEKHTCESLTDGTYGGKKVRVCYTTESTFPQYLYVDSDGYIIATSLTMFNPYLAGGVNQTSSFNFTYAFKEPKLEEFTVNSKFVSICNKKAYEVPKTMCNSLASTTKAALLLVLVAVAATLF
jgi:hypothetical protein